MPEKPSSMLFERTNLLEEMFLHGKLNLLELEELVQLYCVAIEYYAYLDDPIHLYFLDKI
jgi:hypothetical protein